MKVVFGKGKTKHGPGVSIKLTGSEVATAIRSFLVAHNVHVDGPSTVSVNNDLCKECEIYVDPIGNVIYEGKRFTGSGKIES